MRPVSFTTDMTSDTTAGDGDGEPPGDGDGDTHGDGDGDGEPGGPAPVVVDTSPAPGAAAVPANAPVSVSFSEVMDPATITTNGGALACSGAIRVSDDDFATCLPLDAAVMDAGDSTSFTVTPLGGFASRRDYAIGVAGYATSLAGVEMGADFTAEGSFQTAYFHTLTIDGNNDFDVGDETFATTSGGFAGYVAWDLDNLYLGLEGPDVGGGSPNVFVFAYLGGNGGSTAGVDYMGQSPTLPFPARWHVRWKADGTYTNMQEYSGGWVDSDGSWPNLADVRASGDFVELRIPRSAIADPATVPLVMGVLREGVNAATFAGVPESAFSDGFDPNFTSYFEFELDGSALPVEHAAM